MATKTTKPKTTKTATKTAAKPKAPKAEEPMMEAKAEKRPTLTKTDMTAEYARRIGISKEKANQQLTEMANMVTEMSMRGNLHWNGLGTFEIRDRAARKGRDPRTGEPIDIQAAKTLAFKPEPRVRKHVNEQMMT